MTKFYKTFLEKDYQKILQLIVNKRLENGLTQNELAEKLGLSESGYFKIEKGVSRLDVMRFIYILTILKIAPKDFFAELENTNELEFLYRHSLTKNKE